MKIAVLFAAAALLQSAPAKVDIVSVAGCLREPSAGTWMLVNATDPVPSSANAPEKKEIPAMPPVGKNQFRLIGVSEFNLPAKITRSSSKGCTSRHSRSAASTSPR